MKAITLSLEDAQEAMEAAHLAAEFMSENAETHERYCEAEMAAEERANEDRFNALCGKLSDLIEAAKAS